MYLWPVLSCAALVLLYVLEVCYKWRIRRQFAHLPTYPALPFLGHIHKFFGPRQVIYKKIEEISKIMDDTASPFHLYIGPLPILLVSEPEDVRTVTNAFVEKPYYYSFGREWLGDGLVTAPGHIWKRNIKKLAGTFTGNIVDGYQGVFNAQAQKLVDKLQAKVGQPLDMINDLAYTTLEAICQTALGVPQITESIVTEKYYQAFNRVLELMMMRGMNLLTHLEWVYKLTAGHKEMQECVATLHSVSQTIMEKRKKEREEMKKNGIPFDQNKNKDDGKSRFKAFYDILHELSETDASLTEEQIRAEVDTIIVGGQETVATTLLFALLVLGSDARVQEKLYAEIKEVFGDSKRPIKQEDMTRLKYFEACICETLRMYPPFPCVMRHADHDLPLKSCTILKGTSCVINVLGAGRSKRSWGADAHEFRPERWLERPQPPPATFLAFSYGKRACIGRRYAMTILKTILAYIVRDYRLQADIAAVDIKLELVLRPVSGHRIQFTKRM